MVVQLVPVEVKQQHMPRHVKREGIARHARQPHVAVTVFVARHELQDQPEHLHVWESWTSVSLVGIVVHGGGGKKDACATHSVVAVAFRMSGGFAFVALRRGCGLVNVLCTNTVSILFNSLVFFVSSTSPREPSPQGEYASRVGRHNFWATHRLVEQMLPRHVDRWDWTIACYVVLSCAEACGSYLVSTADTAEHSVHPAVPT